jgi:L-lactate dehydrogenase complex protein LldF
MEAMAKTLSSPRLYKIAGNAGRWLMKNFPFTVNNKFNPWYKQRDMPGAKKESFKSWYKNNG